MQGTFAVLQNNLITEHQIQVHMIDSSNNETWGSGVKRNAGMRNK